MTLGALALAASVVLAGLDGEYRSALDLLYDGSTDTALDRLKVLEERNPGDPVGPYLAALAWCWKVEQRGDVRDLDPQVLGLADAAIARADLRLSLDKEDARALFARGAAHGVKSRLALFRLERRGAAREAGLMREDLLQAQRLDPGNKDVLFGIGLYDYYVDVLPRAAKILRFLFGMPGGDRKRGLLEIQAAREGSSFQGAEVRSQLYEIGAFYENDFDSAKEAMAGLHSRYKNAPLWALKLAEHQRDRMGLFSLASTTAQEVVAAARSGNPNVSRAALAMALCSSGESLLADLRLDEAEDVLRKATDGANWAPELTPRAHLLLGETLELEGHRLDAEAHYGVAATSSDRDVRQRAERFLRQPLSETEVRALRLLGEARRLREGGRRLEAAECFRGAASLSPGLREAAMRVSEDDLMAGRLATARRALVEIVDARDCAPWILVWSRLLLGRAYDAGGNREAALVLYKEVLSHPLGRAELRLASQAGLDRPWHPGPGRGDGRNR